MSLPIITEREIKDKRHSETRFRDLVMFYSVGCHHCNSWEEQVETLVSKYPQINFYKLVVTDVTLPICAPPVVPSLVAFDNGYRSWEALGSLQNTGPLEVMIEEWLADSIDIKNVSGSQFISP
jgi:hypothetical protein